MKKISIEEMKKIELELLEKFVDFCEKRDLNVYLGGGTLLGAVRHKGFIPWDDDIDVMMMRDDYEKMLKFASHERIGDNCDIISCENRRDYYYAFAKVVDTRTCMDEFEQTPIFGMGVYIDVFPIDYAPRKNQIESLFRKKRFYTNMNHLVNGKARMAKPKNAFKKILKLVLMPVGAIIPTNYPAKKLDGLAKHNHREDSEQVLCVSGRYDEVEIMPESYIEKSTKVEFEGRKYLAPVGYHDYLVKHYGKNYMELPPKEKRVSNHENNCYWREQ